LAGGGPSSATPAQYGPGEDIVVTKEKVKLADSKEGPIAPPSCVAQLGPIKINRNISSPECPLLPVVPMNVIG
jgi:hypothetical protein